MRISPYRSNQCGSNPRVTARKARIYAAANNGKLHTPHYGPLGDDTHQVCGK